MSRIVELINDEGEVLSPLTSADIVTCASGKTVEQMMSEEKTEMYTPTIECSHTMFKVGQGDTVDYSENVVNGAYESMVLKGKSMVNCIQESSSQDVVLPYEFEDGRYVTINDTKESGALGVELKGQTLVNLAKVRTYTTTTNIYQSTEDIAIKPSTKYYIYCNFTLTNLDAFSSDGMIFRVDTFNSSNVEKQVGVVSVVRNDISSTSATISQVFTTSNEGAFIRILPRNGYNTGSSNTLTVDNIMVLEYQEGMENWDIPYFEGMASCKMPSLHTVGKNLFDVKKAIPKVNLTIGENYLEYYRENGNAHARFDVPVSGFEIGKHYKYSANVEFLEVTEEFKFNNSLNGYVTQMNYYPTYNNNTGTSEGYITAKSTTITFGFHNSNINGAIKTRWSNIQIEEVESLTSPKTTYEPYKSSILSLPEEVVLRGLPNGVRDTFNTRTGVYTQNCIELIYDGETNSGANISISAAGTTENTNSFSLHLPSLGLDTAGGVCDCLKIVGLDDDEKGIVFGRGGAGNVFIKTDKTIATIAQLKEWLKNNNIRVVVRTTPIVTKINLPSALKSWNTTTHVYSEIPENTLYPTLSHSNPTYPVILKPSTKYSIVANSYSNGHTNSPINFNLGGATATTTVGNRVTAIATPSTLSNELLTMSGRGNKLSNVMVIEGEVVGDEPYFEGICDCKSPILSNVGKNLFDYSGHPITLDKLAYVDGKPEVWLDYIGIKTYVPVKENTTYTYSNDINVGIYYGLVFYDSNKNVLSNINYYGNHARIKTFTTPKGCKFIRFAMKTQQIPQWIQIEESSSATPYEPYKSNILSANGDEIKLTEDMFEQGGVSYPNTYPTTSTFDSIKYPSDHRIRIKDLHSIKPNTTHKIKIQNGDSYWIGLQGYNNDGVPINFDTSWGWYGGECVFTTPSNMTKFAIAIRKPDSSVITLSDFGKIEFELREVDKTIVLRSLPNGVCDTLNVETGEYVQRIGELVADGSNIGYKVNGIGVGEMDTFRFQLSDPSIKNVPEVKGNLICDQLPWRVIWSASVERTIGCYAANSENRIIVRMLKEKFDTLNVDGINRYLTNNPITFQYELAEPIVKTVDLSGYPFAYKNGHVILSSGSIEQSLTPTVEYALPINRTGQIEQNTKQVIRHDQMISSLESRLLSQLVDSRYKLSLLEFDYELSLF